MSFILNFYKSSIGKKWIVALTGLVLIAYVIGHLIGNLHIFMGAAQINWYARRLHSMGPLLYLVRAFLLACFVLHIVTTIKLAVENRMARSQKYAVNTSVQATAASKTMVLSGLILLCFVVFHLLHFTTRSTDARFKPIAEGGMLHGEYDVYTMLILAFKNPLASGFYILGMFLLCSHLSHGFQSFVQTLGLTSRKWICTLSCGSRALAWLIFAGYVSIPVSVMFGFLHIVK
jgi:succinate dehydrogenase / fumarate reductase cytochrome b subunit